MISAWVCVVVSVYAMFVRVVRFLLSLLCSLLSKPLLFYDKEDLRGVCVIVYYQ